MGADSSHNCSGRDRDKANGCGKAVASSGPLSVKDDRRGRPMAVLGDIGGVRTNNDSEDPRKTYMIRKLGSYQNSKSEAGCATDHLGLAQS